MTDPWLNSLYTGENGGRGVMNFSNKCMIVGESSRSFN